MKKKLLGLVLAGMMILGLAACGEKQEETPGNDEANVKVEEITQKVTESLDYGSMIKLDDETLEQYYGLDASLLEAYDANIPMMNITTQEYSVFKVKDEKDMDTVMAAIEKRAGDVQKSFEEYLPDQYENAKNYYAESNGKYAIFVIHEKSEDVKEIFQGFLNNR